MAWSKRDTDWLRQYHPRTKVVNGTTIEGKFDFQMLYAGGRFFVNPSPAQIASSTDGLYLSDVYEVRIKHMKGRRPVAYEIGGRLAAVAKKLDIKSLADMHQFKSKALCLAAPMAIDRAFGKRFSLEVYVEEFLIPYLFAQSHFAHTRKWLWGDLEHGHLGLLEWLAREPTPRAQDIATTQIEVEREAGGQLLRSRPRGHNPCPCGSKKKFRDCHPDAMEGIIIIRNEIARGGQSRRDAVKKELERLAESAEAASHATRAKAI